MGKLIRSNSVRQSNNALILFSGYLYISDPYQVWVTDRIVWFAFVGTEIHFGFHDIMG